MVASLVYRTADFTRWGGGQGSDLAAVTIDLNFWTLFSAVQALEDHADVAAGIDFISQPTGGNIFYVHLTDHRVLGPFTIPTSQWNPRGDWAPTTPYAAFDTVANNGSLYLVNVTHTSGSTFSSAATDGHGNLLYILILNQLSQNLPAAGTPGQRLVKSTSSPYTTEWLSDLIRLAVYVEGQPNPNEKIMQYCVVDEMTLPVGLAGSSFFSAINTSTNVQYSLFQNGTFIGSINFNGPSPETITVTFPVQVDCEPGDVLTLFAPGTPDINQADISFTIAATLII